MDKKAQQYWKDHELYRFIVFEFDLYTSICGDGEIIGTVEHNGWKFFVLDDGCIRYITPSGENGYFIDC